MKVWFGTTTAELEKYRSYYYKIRQIILDHNCVILFDWLKDAENALAKKRGGKRGMPEIFTQVVDAITRADISIIEYTVPNFSSSHQIMLSIMKRKPTLVLRLQTDNQYFRDSYLEGLNSDLLHIVDYKEEQLEEIISKFLKKSEIGVGFKRYNIVLDSRTNHFLEWMSGKYSLSRSEVIREALKNQAKKEKEFDSYL